MCVLRDNATQGGPLSALRAHSPAVHPTSVGEASAEEAYAGLIQTGTSAVNATRQLD